MTPVHLLASTLYPGSRGEVKLAVFRKAKAALSDGRLQASVRDHGYIVARILVHEDGFEPPMLLRNGRSDLQSDAFATQPLVQIWRKRREFNPRCHLPMDTPVFETGDFSNSSTLPFWRRRRGSNADGLSALAD